MSAILAFGDESEAAMSDRLKPRMFWRIMPILFVAYGMACLDRVNAALILIPRQVQDKGGSCR